MSGSLEDLAIATYKPLFEAERTRRDQIRASLGVPMTAMSVTMVGFGVLLNNFVWRVDTVLGLALSGLVVALALASAACLATGLVLLVRADRPEVRMDPSSLTEIQRFAKARKDELKSLGSSTAGEVVLREVKAFLAEDYAECYVYMVEVNARLLRLRDSALRLLAAALVMLLVAFVVTGLDKHHAIDVLASASGQADRRGVY
ncbi:hypothetical protein HL658_19320 [Azospirillum sp. RWY-5-1]|uniref:Uncharacterized protein n=1 Tax=Azospirillum oleiclasticum TaxID=2735135 RepID=A0ABX2TH03_9PROT|nr:hypothetical protein [Azospirillum oleiclasticum]NYZ14705.1 hypothetical protein [Azospirillum oleiclasticum]NYZ22309.1 hypothetical protein [Azospirillum oleiclasticum]